MKELSLHILDIIQNSITAKSSLINIKIIEDLINDILIVEIIDNGIGMDEELLEKVLDPFVTTRTTRKIGLGLPLFQALAIQCDGDFKISSKVGQGTNIVASFKYSHIDRPPLGNMADTLITCIMADGNIDYYYEHYYYDEHYYAKNKFIFDTRKVKEKIGELPITDILVINWLKEYFKENLCVLVKR